ncbi:hypothetical protein MJT46_015862 [Ovis ammon polii x Ovis aries]|nr:hypothetical protein MJT46_015862 [Ovis ammon polii x Ovis aries]
METQMASPSLGRCSLWLLLLGLLLPSASAQALSYREAVLRAVGQLNEKSSEVNLYRLLELDPPPKDAEDQGARKPVSFRVKETVCPRTSQQPPEQCDFKENGLVKQCVGTVSLDTSNDEFDLNSSECEETSPPAPTFAKAKAKAKAKVIAITTATAKANSKAIAITTTSAKANSKAIANTSATAKANSKAIAITSSTAKANSKAIAITSSTAKANSKAIAITTATAKANSKAIAITTATAKANSKAIAVTTATAKSNSKATVIIIGKANIKVTTVAKTSAKPTSIPADISHSKVSWKTAKDWVTSHPLKNFDES